MWLATKMGFFSIVKKGEMFGDDTWCIRSRAKHDLENLKKFISLKCDIIDTAKFDGTEDATDYHYRLYIDGHELDYLFKSLPATIEYPNFKQMIHADPDQAEKHHFYLDCWKALWIYQEVKERLAKNYKNKRSNKKENPYKRVFGIDVETIDA